MVAVFFFVFFSQADPNFPVLVAGDMERMNMQECDKMGGIPYHINVVNHMVRAAVNKKMNE